MKFSYQWLKELSGTKKTPEQLAKLLMMRAFEVESVERSGTELETLVIGEVVDLEKHPGADRLRIATVKIRRGETRQIVCGAPNIEVGQKVVVALPGTVLPGDFRIEEAKIRGMLSEGMICSEREIGLGDAHEGILVLPEDAPTGALFARHYGVSDAVLDINILPNRGSDALSYEGMAREIAALDGYAPRFEEKPKKRLRVPSYNRAPKTRLADKAGCLRYLGLHIKDISIAESPFWLRLKLHQAGLRPRNNAVDITNYLMLLSGQPIHAFDSDKIEGAVTVRRAKKNERLTLLDGRSLRLDPEDVVIADDKGALALAGVMGGKRSAVTDTTKNVFVEIAVFDAASIRKTKLRHNLPTDASYRFERGLDPNLPGTVADSAYQLFSTLAGGKLSGLRDIYPKPVRPARIKLSLQRVEDVLGVKIALFEVVQFLALLGLGVKKRANVKALDVTVPTRRPDLRDEWDLIEEIGRLYGFDRIPAAAPQPALALPARAASQHFRRDLKETLAASGFTEALTYSFYGADAVEAFSLKSGSHLELENPMSPDQAFLRQSLLPNLLQKAGENHRFFNDVALFEVGSAFAKNKKAEEKEKVAFLISAEAGAGTLEERFLAFKSHALRIFSRLGVRELAIVPLSDSSAAFHPFLEPSQSGHLVANPSGDIVGIIGCLKPGVRRRLDIAAHDVVLAECDLAALQAVQESVPHFRPLPRFPAVRRDISVAFPESVHVGTVEAAFWQVGAPLLTSLDLFDVYRKDGEKSLAFHLEFSLPERTLTMEEAEESFQKIARAATELGGAVRS